MKLNRFSHRILLLIGLLGSVFAKDAAAVSCNGFSCTLSNNSCEAYNGPILAGVPVYPPCPATCPTRLEVVSGANIIITCSGQSTAPSATTTWTVADPIAVDPIAVTPRGPAVEGITLP